MPNQPYRRPGGGLPHPRELDRLMADAERLSRTTTGGDGMVVGEVMGQRQFLDVAQRGFWARLGTRNGTTGYYPFTRVDDSGSTYPDQAGAESSDGTATSVPCFEVGGSTTVPSGTKVWLQPNVLGAGYTFVAPPAAGVTVTTVDGSPSFSAVTTFRFDELDGVVISQPAPGIVRVDLLPATTTQAGVVSTSPQLLAGNKFVRDTDKVGLTTSLVSTPLVALEKLTVGDAVAGFVTGGSVTNGGAVTSSGAGSYTTALTFVSGSEAITLSARSLTGAYVVPRFDVYVPGVGYLQGYTGQLIDGTSVAGGVVAGPPGSRLLIPQKADGDSVNLELYYSTTAGVLSFNTLGTYNRLY